MLRTVAPHDLIAICKECNTTLATLSFETGIPQQGLLAYAAGRLGLSATESMAIIFVLNNHAGEHHHAVCPNYRPSVMTEVAYRRLCDEVEEEREQLTVLN